MALERPESARPQAVLAMQRQLGNRAVSGLLHGGRSGGEAGPASGASHSASSSRSRPSSLTIQPQLEVTGAQDPTEREADRVADRVMQTISAGAPSDPGIGGGRSGGVMREIAATPQAGPGGGVMREIAATPQAGLGGGEVPVGVESGIQQVRGGGQPLGARLRSSMEGGFGADFAGVRVHTDGHADRLNRSLEAKAFTTGQDIFFREGAYQPETSSGQRLLAHELTHVVQQSGQVQRKPLIQRYALVPQGGNVNGFSFEGEGHRFPGQVRRPDEVYFKDDEGNLTIREETPEAIDDFYKDIGATDRFALKISGNAGVAVERNTRGRQAKGFYAKPGIIAESNRKLKAVGSVIELVEQSETLKVHKEDQEETLSRVYPRNIWTPKEEHAATAQVKSNQVETTEGLEMLGRQECIMFAKHLIGLDKEKVGSSTAKAPINKLAGPLARAQQFILDDKVRGTILQAARTEAVSLLSSNAKTIQQYQSKLAGQHSRTIDLMFELRDCMTEDAAPSSALQGLLEAVYECDNYQQMLASQPFSGLVAALQKVKGYEAGWFEGTVCKAFYDGAVGFKAYLLLKNKGDAYDELVEATGINQHANPDVGEAFQNYNLVQHRTDQDLEDADTTKLEWNFHWAGVVARDGEDFVTLENSTSDNVNKYRDPAWRFDMYGPAEQSFHEVQAARLPNSTTLTTARRNPAPTVESPEVQDDLLEVEDAQQPSTGPSPLLTPQVQAPTVARTARLENLSLADRFTRVRADLVASSMAGQNARRLRGRFGKSTAYGKIITKLDQCAQLAADDPGFEETRVMRRKMGKIIAYARAEARSQHAALGTSARRNAALEALIADVEYIRLHL